MSEPDLRAAFERVFGPVDWDNLPTAGYDPSLDVDGDTKIRGKSRAAARAEWRPLRVKYQDGGVSYNGGRTWGPDDE